MVSCSGVRGNHERIEESAGGVMSYSDPKLWFSFKGRVNRRPYFFAGLAVSALIEAHRLIPGGYALVYIPIMLFAFYVSLAIGVKRCHDRDRTGFFMLLNFVPILNLWPLI